MTTVTRFAPSPTGFLHIGSARTALFNWLFARRHGGKFLLRIEDTDRARSTQEAVDAILEGMRWLGLDWNGEPISQFERADRHRDVVDQLLAEGKAYRCYCSPEELDAMRSEAREQGRPMLYDGRWRDRDPSESPDGVAPAIRLKAPREGETLVPDKVQGDVTVPNSQMDDMVLLRSDGTPTYMLAVVVDDHDMDVTDVIRGDDHFTNTFRQMQLFNALGWTPPTYGHMPLTHGDDGAKLSKRHGAVAIDSYREMGFLPEAMRNYLLRLGWSHGDDEIFSTEQMTEWFGYEGIGKSPGRFDMAKLTSLNGHYIRQADDWRLAELALPLIGAQDPDGKLARAMPGLKDRAKTLVELAESAGFYFAARPLVIEDKAKKNLKPDALDMLGRLSPALADIPEWTDSAIEDAVRAFAEAEGLKLGKIAQPLRAALTGSAVSPGIFEVMAVLGREEALGRIEDARQGA